MSIREIFRGCLLVRASLTQSVRGQKVFFVLS
jgi:hypothetical protein